MLYAHIISSMLANFNELTALLEFINTIAETIYLHTALSRCL